MMENVDENIDFLGKGWSFPVRFDRLFSKVDLSIGNKDIHESLNILLGTIPGERFLHPDFGCDLRDLSFEKLDPSLETIIEDKIRAAILIYEPRIRVDQIYFESDVNEGIIFIHILYIINTTNVRTNMVYPFYIKEGTDL